MWNRDHIFYLLFFLYIYIFLEKQQKFSFFKTIKTTHVNILVQTLLAMQLIIVFGDAIAYHVPSRTTKHYL